jgi:flagellar basal body P-ring formation protein FlgA
MLINSIATGLSSVLLATGLIFVNLADEANAAGRLKAEAIVSTDTIRLGELIEGLDASADAPLFKAPVPGARGTIRAERVLEAARELGIEGIATHNIKTVTIIRPGRTISRQDMEEALSRIAAKQGAQGDVAITLDDTFGPRIVDAAQKDDLKITKFTRDPRLGRFEARLTLADASENWLVTGSILETREVAVPVADIERGEPLKAQDFILTKRPAGQVGSDVVAPLADLIGMVPRRVLRAGEPVRNADIAKPVLVEKNQLVMVMYNAKGFSLTMRGRANSNGTMGETIKVQNPQSKRIVDAVVTGYGQVSVSAPPAPQVAEAPAEQR